MAPVFFMYSNDMGVSTLRIAPSILSADFTAIASAIDRIEQSGADWIHLDVMDGHFVPNLTFGPKMVADIRKLTTLPLDVHLMVQNPDISIPWYIESGADHITFHSEACVHAHRAVQQIQAARVRAGISIVPSTPVAAIEPLLDCVDIVLVMSVNPGFGGQQFIPSTLQKVSQLARARDNAGARYDIVIDGGVNQGTGQQLAAAGADVLVSGSAFFQAPEPARFVQALKNPGAAV